MVDTESLARTSNPQFEIRNPQLAMYTELHCHSAFSFLDGASLPEQLALTASQLGYAGLALTDHNGLYGSLAFAHEAKQLGLQAITGAELTLVDGSHVTLLAETPDGYANLCRLITEAHLGSADRRDPRLDFAPPGRSPSAAAPCSAPNGSSSSCSATTCGAIGP
jgi:DNA polymerase III alpha subunit